MFFLCQTAKNKMATIPFSENPKSCLRIVLFSIYGYVIPQNDESGTNKLILAIFCLATGMDSI